MKISSSILAYTTVLSYVSVTMASSYGGGQVNQTAPAIDYGYQVKPVYYDAPGNGGNNIGKYSKQGSRTNKGSKTKKYSEKKNGSGSKNKKGKVPCPPKKYTKKRLVPKPKCTTIVPVYPTSTPYVTPIVSPHVSPVVTSNAPVVRTTTVKPVETSYVIATPEPTEYESPINVSPISSESPEYEDDSTNPIFSGGYKLMSSIAIGLAISFALL